ncbi:MAG: AraC family transcriptional regulator [Pseudomonadota bacterium]
MTDPVLTSPRIDPELPPSADPLAEVLQLLKLSGVLYCDARLTSPWGLEIPELPGVMNVEVVTAGACWLEVEGEPAVFLPQGSLALIPRGRRHRLRGNPGDKTTPLEDVPVELLGDRFERMRFGGSGAETRVMYYGVRYDPYLAERLIDLLPEALTVRSQAGDPDWLHHTIRFIAQEAEQRRPGSETMITRLADILVVQAIRSWIDSVRDEAEGWIAALHDRRIGKAMSLMHRQPARNWQVATLARETGMSRSGFSARFTALVGDSALNYLTRLRMQLAHRDLRESDDTLARIAERVGYQSESAFNRAFKRVVGCPPGALRKRPETA